MMASELLYHIQEDHLTCQICQCSYFKPKALPCVHTFCESCLRDYIFSRHYDQIGHFPCPLCRQEIRIPTEGVEHFPDNHLVVGLQDTVDQSENLVNSQQEANRNPPGPLPPGGGTVGERPPCPVAAAPPRLRIGVPVRHNFQGAELSFGQLGPSVTDFSKPVGLAASSEYIVVSDQNANRIMVFDWHGKMKTLFKCPGKVHDIAMTKRGQIVVANSKAGKSLATEHQLNGQTVASHGNMFEFEKAHGIAILNEEGDLVITSNETNTTFLLNQKGKLLQKFGGGGHSDPRHVATTVDQKILISNYGSHNIKICNKFGKLLDRIGGEGQCRGDLRHPLGICVDRWGNIVVADWGNQRVQVLSVDGNYHDLVVDYRRSAEPMAPVNVALSKDSKRLAVLVVGPHTAEVRIYSYRGLVNKAPVMSSFCTCS